MRKLEFPVQFRENRDSNGKLQECWLCSTGSTFYVEAFAKLMEKRLKGEKVRISRKD